LESISYDSSVLAAIRDWLLGLKVTTAALFVTTEASKLPLQGLNFTTACLYVSTARLNFTTARLIVTTACLYVTTKAKIVSTAAVVAYWLLDYDW
jgi:hypothetical protein